MQPLRQQLGGLLPLTISASPARTCRRRRSLACAASLVVACGVLLLGAPRRAAAEPAGSCAAPGTGWCVARRFVDGVPNGELGFRFGEPLDVDGDGRADVAGGSRFKLQQMTQQTGDARVWSGATGASIRAWEGEWPDGLFGHDVLLVPDVSGDGLADVVVAAPHARVEGVARGVLVARSPATGTELWKRTETEGENLGWDLALAGDQNGDGLADLFVGATAQYDGRVYLLSGKDGAVLQTYAAPPGGETFGWYVARLDDLDGDGRADLAVGAPSALDEKGERVGAAWVLSSASGRELHHWSGTDRRGGFGGIVTGLADLDGDGTGEIAVASPGTEDPARTLSGEVRVYSGKSGAEIRRWSGSQAGEQFGRMVVGTADLDGDGVGDVAIGAPLHRVGGDDRVGRMELRSGRSGDVLGSLLGDEANCWFGWHIRRAPDPDGHGRPALLIASLRHPVDGKVGAGVLDLYVLRPASDASDQGTTTRGERRSDIK